MCTRSGCTTSSERDAFGWNKFSFPTLNARSANLTTQWKSAVLRTHCPLSPLAQERGESAQYPSTWSESFSSFGYCLRASIREEGGGMALRIPSKRQRCLSASSRGCSERLQTRSASRFKPHDVCKLTASGGLWLPPSWEIWAAALPCGNGRDSGVEAS
jgi:hypothetical protein